MIGRWLQKFKQEVHLNEMAKNLEKKKTVLKMKEFPEDVKQLQDQLRMANLKNQLLKAMPDIGKEQHGLDLRKKSGTKQ